jgi:hypothetical protein
MACRMQRRKEKKHAQKVLVRNHKEKKLLGSPRYRLEETLRWILKYVRWKGVELMDLAQDTNRWWVM